MKRNQFVIIPSLNPDDKLVNLVEQLNENGFLFNNIIVVDDGSSEQYNSFFDRLLLQGCVVLKHSINQGKGQALKTAYTYLLDNNSEDISVVCADADGQHAVDDIISCINAVKPNTLIIGCRQFSDKSIPYRSRFGNKLTCSVFRVLCGISVSDTQTGLRAMDNEIMRKFLLVEGSRFEFEMNMLIETKELEIDLEEIPIKTIYIEENKTSHFNPLKDSLRIYKVFAKFLVASLLSFFIDIVAFTIILELVKLTPYAEYSIIAAGVGARIGSSLANYLLNKNAVFKSKNNTQGEREYCTIVKYYALCIVQISISTIAVWMLSFVMPIHSTITKAMVDIILFMISFQIQREWVFKK